MQQKKQGKKGFDMSLKMELYAAFLILKIGKNLHFIPCASNLPHKERNRRINRGTGRPILNGCLPCILAADP